MISSLCGSKYKENNSVALAEIFQIRKITYKCNEGSPSVKEAKLFRLTAPGYMGRVSGIV